MRTKSEIEKDLAKSRQKYEQALADGSTAKANAFKDAVDEYEAELAELEASEKASAGKGSVKEKPVKQPKAPKAPKAKEGEEEEGDSTPPPPTGKDKPDNIKGEEELACEKLIRAAKIERNKKNQDWLVKFIQSQKKSTKGEFSKEKLEEKTVGDLRIMAGFSKPRGEKLLDDAKRAMDSYSKTPVKSYVKKAETPEKQKEIAETAAQLQEKFAKEIATFVKEKELELKNELEKLLK